MMNVKVINLESLEGFGLHPDSGRNFLIHISSINLWKGLSIAFVLHAALITSYYVSAVLLKEDISMRTVRFVDANELTSAAPLEKTAEPVKVDVQMNEIPKVIAGIPIVVPDAEAPSDVTLQTQEEIKTNIAASSFSLGNAGEGEIKVDISESLRGLNESSDEPGMDEFIPVEQAPILLAKVIPEYPEIARQAGIEGKVFLKALVNEEGVVVKVVYIQGDDMFKEAAVNALSQARFKPAINGNRPVKVWISYPFIFRLRTTQ
ncbi:energy transducer TonB [bacterium]|nr:energy transducer TonB [bacterium]NUN45125.1 energy transducer TonB [bacterium]